MFQRSAAESLGIQMPTHGAGAVQIPRVTTAPPADVLAKDAAAPAAAAVIALDSQTPKRISGQFEVRAEDLAVYPELWSQCSGSPFVGLSRTSSTTKFSTGLSYAGLNGLLFAQAADVAVAGAVETYASGVARFAALVDGQYSPTAWPTLRCVSRAFEHVREIHGAHLATAIPLADYLESKLGSFPSLGPNARSRRERPEGYCDSDRRPQPDSRLRMECT